MTFLISEDLLCASTNTPVVAIDILEDENAFQIALDEAVTAVEVLFTQLTEETSASAQIPTTTKEEVEKLKEQLFDARRLMQSIKRTDTKRKVVDVCYTVIKAINNVALGLLSAYMFLVRYLTERVTKLFNVLWIVGIIVAPILLLISWLCNSVYKLISRMAVDVETVRTMQSQLESKRHIYEKLQQADNRKINEQATQILRTIDRFKDYKVGTQGIINTDSAGKIIGSTNKLDR